MTEPLQERTEAWNMYRGLQFVMIISFPTVALNTPQNFKLFGIIPTEILFTLMVLSVRYLMDINNRAEWVRCPVCGNKTRLQIRADTELKNFPLYCPKCRQESLIDAKDLQVTVIKGLAMKNQNA